VGSNAKGAWPQLAAGFWWAIGTAIAYGLMVALVSAMTAEVEGDGAEVAPQGGAACLVSKPWA